MTFFVDYYFEYSSIFILKKKYAGGIVRGKTLILLLVELKALAVIQKKATYSTNICVSIFILEGRCKEHSSETGPFTSSEAIF